jgi:hypothetical protein
MMVAASDGRLENSELANYYNELVEADGGNNERAAARIQQLQNMAAGKRTSQAEKYGLQFRADPDTGQMKAYDVYEDPAGPAAQASFGRTSSADIGNGKSEEFKDPEGHLSGWSQTILAATSDYKMHTVPLVDERGQRIKDPRSGHYKTTLEVLRDDSGVPVQKDEQGKRDAQAARAKITSIEGYAQGDTGVGGQIYRLMDEAKRLESTPIPTWRGDPSESDPDHRPPTGGGGQPPIGGQPTLPGMGGIGRMPGS